MLFLYESKFYEFTSHQEYKLWTNCIVKKVGNLLKALIHERPIDSKLYDIGTSYFTLLDPDLQLFGKILITQQMGKIASIYFHQIFTNAFSQDLRQLILKIWEFLDHENFQCDSMLFYIENTTENLSLIHI